MQLVNTKEMQVEAKHIVGIDSSHNIVKMFDIVQFVPNLRYNFFIVGQPMSNGEVLLLLQVQLLS